MENIDYARQPASSELRQTYNSSLKWIKQNAKATISDQEN